MDIILTGSVAYDYLMTFPGKFRDHILPDKLDTISLSFLVESMVRRRGGVAPNIAYTMALLGEKPRLFAAVGVDFDDYGAWLAEQGVYISLVRVISDVNTASFFANTDRENNQIASFYPGAMSYARELSFYDLGEQHPDLVVISPNDPEAMNRYVDECQELFIPYLYDPSQQIVRLSGEELRAGVEGAKALFVNEYEFGLIQNKTGMTADEIRDQLELMVVTLGEKGAVIFAADQQFEIGVVPPKEIVDPTGVGDAFRGGFLTGFSKGWDWPLCAQMGALAATYCLEQNGPQGHHYTLDQFIARFRDHFDDAGALEALVRSPHSNP